MVPSIPKPTPPGVAEEGMVRRQNGRPPRRPPMSSILRILKGIEDQVMAGITPDPGYSRKVLADFACITLERAFTADDDEIPLKLRADMALRIGPVVSMLETLIPKGAGSGMPKTEAALDNEIEGRLGRLNKLLAKKADVPVDVIMDTLAPAASQPPEEA